MKMIRKERRRHFLINLPLQFRYMLTITFTLLVVTFVCGVSLYFGIWGGVIGAFSKESVRNDLLTASRLQDYEAAAHPQAQPAEPFSVLSYIRSAERLSERQREVFKEILDETKQALVGKLLLLLVFIAWGTIFLSHKVAGPLYRFQKILNDIATGDLTIRCQLRKFDEAKPVAQNFNQTLEFLDTTVSRLKNIVREDEKNTDRLLARLKEVLFKFKTSP